MLFRLVLTQLIYYHCLYSSRAISTSGNHLSTTLYSWDHYHNVFSLSVDKLKFILKKYVYTINHKRLAINYLLFTGWSAMSGVGLATLIRWELAYPGSHFFKGDSLRYMQVITAHGIVMVFFVAVPILFGFMANFFIPYHIGSKDVAFPRLNNFGFWLFPAGYILGAKPAYLKPNFIKYFDKPSFFYQLVDQPFPNLSAKPLEDQNSQEFLASVSEKPVFMFAGHAVHSQYTFSIQSLMTLISTKLPAAYWDYALNLTSIRRKKNHVIRCPNSILTMSGWTFITPFSGNTRFTGVGSQDIAILSVIIVGLSTTISFTNLLITRRTLSMPGLRNRRVLVPFISICLFLTMRMLSLVTPVLGGAMIMLASDRHWGTSFFDYAYGGDVVLFHHLFWFFGHPEVYIILIPMFGAMNSLLPYYTARRIAGKHHLIWATYIMAYMGFLVWGHHMYLVGLDHRSRSMYSTITVMISLPAIVKIVNWTLTILNGHMLFSIPFFFISSFFFFFLSGGLTGLWLSHVGLNIYVHDTFYVVAHFHVMFSASVFSGFFATLYHYYKPIFGVSFKPLFGYLHLFYWVSGQWLTFLPLYWVGYNGLPRRYHDYPLSFLAWHSLSSVGHVLTLISMLFLFIGIFWSFFKQDSTVDFFKGVPRVYKRVHYYLLKINNIDKQYFRVGLRSSEYEMYR